MNIHNIPTTHKINTYTKTIRRQRAPGSDQYQTQPRLDTTSTPASRLTLGGFSDNGTSSPTCSRFRDRGSKPVRHHTQLKARIRLGRISSVLLGGCARLGGSHHTQNHTMAHGTTAEESAMQQLGPDEKCNGGVSPTALGEGCSSMKTRGAVLQSKRTEAPSSLQSSHKLTYVNAGRTTDHNHKLTSSNHITPRQTHCTCEHASGGACWRAPLASQISSPDPCLDPLPCLGFACMHVYLDLPSVPSGASEM